MRRFLTKLLTNSWTVTLVATMIGVFAGIYLNNLYSNRSILQNRANALAQINNEVEKNREILKKSLEAHRYYKGGLSFLFRHLNEDEDLIVHRDTMEIFRETFPNALLLSDSTQVSGDLFNYEGELNFDIKGIPSIELSNVAWETFKASNLASTVNFDCLYQLELLNRLQERVRVENDKLIRMFVGEAEMGERGVLLTAKWNLLLELEDSLLALYDDFIENKGSYCK